MKILITGGCGFIGSNFIRYLLTSEEVKKDAGDIQIVNVDKQTYAGQGRNIEHLGLDKDSRYKLIKADITDKEKINKIFSEEKPEIVFNFAAESHVDRSIDSSSDFIMSNVIGTANLLDASLKNNIKKFIQISTDETYGSIKQGSFKENDILNPSSPYSSSKAGAELIALSYFKTHNLPVIITRSANNYGEYQFPEKILPLFITNLIDNKKVPLMWSESNPGLNVRDWLHVEDNCRAIWLVSQKGGKGEIYNISGENEKTNIEMTKKLLNEFNFGEEMIEKIPHRKGHDFRYSIDGEKLKKLGFEYKHKDLNAETKKLVDWYKENQDWWGRLKEKKIGIVFGAGFLGSRIANELGYKIISYPEINILNVSEIRDFLDSEKPEVVINAVGKTGRPNIDECEIKKEETIQLNVAGAVNLCTECSERGIYFVHLGSGCEYYGNNNGKGWKEEDEPNFYNEQFYAKTKILAEKIIKEFPSLILRLRMPIDDRPATENINGKEYARDFVSKIAKYPKLIDEQNSMTTIPHMIKAMQVLINKKKTGIYNFTNPGTISAAEIMNMYKEIVDANHGFEVFSVEDLGKVVQAKRSNCYLNTEKLQKELKGSGAEMPEIHEAVRECLVKYKECLNKDEYKDEQTGDLK